MDFPLNQSIEYMLILVGGIPTPVKHMKVSWDYYAQYMEKNMFQTTNQYINNVLLQYYCILFIFGVIVGNNM